MTKNGLKNAAATSATHVTCSFGALKLRAPMWRWVTTADGTKPCTNSIAFDSLTMGTCSASIENKFRSRKTCIRMSECK